MQPIDEKGNPWPPEASNLKFRQIRTEVIAEMRKRDERAGISKGKVYSQGEGGLIVNQALQVKRHKGSDTKRELLKRWADFCEKPRSVGSLLEEARAFERKRDIQDARAKIARLEAANAPVKAEEPQRPERPERETPRGTSAVAVG